MCKQIKSLSELLTIMAKLSQEHDSDEKTEQTHEEFLAQSITRAETEIRASEITLGILKATPPRPGAKLAAAEALMPQDPSKHGVLSVVTYGLEDGSFLVIGTDHLTQYRIEHTTPNRKGVEGQVEAVRHELAKQSAEVCKATEKAAQPEPETVH